MTKNCSNLCMTGFDLACCGTCLYESSNTSCLDTSSLQWPDCACRELSSLRRIFIFATRSRLYFGRLSSFSNRIFGEPGLTLLVMKGVEAELVRASPLELLGLDSWPPTRRAAGRMCGALTLATAGFGAGLAGAGEGAGAGGSRAAAIQLIANPSASSGSAATATSVGSSGGRGGRGRLDLEGEAVTGGTGGAETGIGRGVSPLLVVGVEKLGELADL